MAMKIMHGLWVFVLGAWTVAGAAERLWNMPVMATWTEDPRTSVTLAWERSVEGTAVVEYSADAEEWERVAQEEPARRHVFTLRGLQPGTHYQYRVQSSDGFEATGQFWSAPADPSHPFTFALHNDLQGGINVEAAKQVAQAVVRAHPDFVLSTGDLGDSRYSSDYANGVQSWQLFFDCTEPELANFVFQPVTGNHDEPENPDSFWHRLLELPSHHDYVLDVGPIRFVMLDSAEEQIPSRIAWLARELQRAAYDPAITWVIPAFHRPPFSYGERGGQEQVREWWVPLFTRYEADLVLSGHAHTYQRTKPLAGVNYLVSGGGGGRLYWVPEKHENLLFATSLYHFVQCSVAGDRIQLAATATNGTVFDRAEYKARRHVRVEPIFPARGEPCTVWYNAAGGPLADAQQISVHVGRDNFADFLMDVPLEKDAATGLWKATFTTPAAAKWNVAFCFFDPVNKVWHNNYQQDWQALVAREW